MFRTSYNFQFGRGTSVVAPGFGATYERESFNPTGSSIVLGGGVAGSDLISINPLDQVTQSSASTWLTPGVDLVGMTGRTPTFRWLRASARHFDGNWQSTRKCMYSLDDGRTWAYFSTAGVKDVGNNWIQWQHNAAFTQNKIRVAVARQISVHQTGTRIAELAAAFAFVQPAPSAVAYTPTANVSDYVAQDYIANEFATQTDTLGRTVPVTPLYAGQINDTSLMPASGPKKVWLVNGGTHAGEDLGDVSMWIMLNWLCGATTAAQELRRNFRIIFYPMTTPQGRVGGGWRGIWGGSPDDPNRNMDVNNMQAVTHQKAATATDFAGLPLKIFTDWHGTWENSWECTAGTNTVDSNFRNKLIALTGFTIVDIGVLLPSRKSGWYHTAASDGFAGAVLSVTLEHGDPTPTSDADLTLFAQSAGTAIYQMFNEGVFA